MANHEVQVAAAEADAGASDIYIDTMMVGELIEILERGGDAAVPLDQARDVLRRILDAVFFYKVGLTEPCLEMLWEILRAAEWCICNICHADKDDTDRIIQMSLRIPQAALWMVGHPGCDKDDQVTDIIASTRHLAGDLSGLDLPATTRQQLKAIVAASSEIMEDEPADAPASMEASQ
jgi:hypothetical protein